MFDSEAKTNARTATGDDLRRQRTAYSSHYVRSLFDKIAPRYDFLNHLLSVGLDVLWRNKAIDRLASQRPQRILDVATGTGDFALAAARLQPREIIGIDLSEEMLHIGREKVERRGLTSLITLQQGDAEHLEFRDQDFDAVLVAFGIRNFSNLHQGLREIYRVLRPGGSFVVLEFSQPRDGLIRLLYGWYSRFVIPRLGGLISRHREAYEYLPKTVSEFPYGEEFLAIVRAVGFHSAAQYPLTFGIVSIYQAFKQ
jgi:demethylmenaquinone methyltransferase/2-methoxy-6-polyprenyl-1,4-benzoquinol methylase